MNHPGFFTDTLGGQTLYRCCLCSYDSFQRKNILQHVAVHPPIHLPETDIPAAEWEEQQKKGPLAGARVVLCLLTWNSCAASTLAAKAIREEYEFLSRIGIHADIYWVDNGSTDDTVGSVHAELPKVHCATLCDSNRGQSVARNYMLDMADRGKADFLMLVDGDIRVIKYSSYALMREARHSSIGCVGMYSYNCTHDASDPTISQECRCIFTGALGPSPKIAWTQYGMFTPAVFKHMRFDEAPCFQGEGWGFEDDDLALQMMEAGLHSLNTNYFRYLHIRRNSSLRRMEPSLAAKVYQDRKAYLVDKWNARVGTNTTMRSYLTGLRNQTIPMLDT